MSAVPWVFLHTLFVDWSNTGQLSVSRDLAELPRILVDDQEGSFHNIHSFSTQIPPGLCTYSTDTTAPLKLQCPPVESHCFLQLCSSNSEDQSPGVYQKYKRLRRKAPNIECLHLFFILICQVTIKYQSNVFLRPLLPLVYFKMSLLFSDITLASFNCN